MYITEKDMHMVSLRLGNSYNPDRIVHWRGQCYHGRVNTEKSYIL